ncbi:MAG: PQQ-like beta-propeller repeat protein [Phycisphaerales bacterium]|nr:PQQ-like beta-propeller repeat protein [Phycisphaerales bacterium]
MQRRLSCGLPICAAALLGQPVATGERVFLACTTDGTVFDLNASTGTAQSPRATELSHVIDIETDAAGRLFTLTSLAGTAPNSLYAVDATSGSATLIGATGLSAIYEGDLAFNASNGFLYGIQSVPQGSRRFFRIDPDTGLAIELAHLGFSGDFSGLTYARDKLFAIDTVADVLYELHPITGTILSSLALSVAIDSSVCGMDYDAETDTMYVVARAVGVEGLFSLDWSSGQMTLIGETGIAGLAGLCIVPEPGVCVMLAGMMTLALRRR